MNEHIFNEIEEKTNADIKDTIRQAVEKAQNDFESDIFGFGERIHKTDPQKWEKLKKEWADVFPDAAVNITVDIQVKRAGTITDPFHQEISEE